MLCTLILSSTTLVWKDDMHKSRSKQILLFTGGADTWHAAGTKRVNTLCFYSCSMTVTCPPRQAAIACKRQHGCEGIEKKKEVVPL